MHSNTAILGRVLGVALLLAGSISLSAQTASRQKHSFSQTKISTCSPEDLAGLFKYDRKEAAKKIGLDAGSEYYGQFNRLLEEHDRNVGAIVDDNRQLFDQLYSLKSDYEDLATQQADFQPLVELIRLMKDQLLPIVGSVERENEYLSTLMGYILNEKQFKKWERYLDKVKKSKEPKYPRPMAGPLLVE